jgi:hypothetical protein
VSTRDARRNARRERRRRWKLGEYLRSTGTLAAAPDPKTFITDEFMKRVAADPKLRAFAEGQ